MSAEASFARLKNGTRLAYVEQGPREAPAIVMMHGLSDSHHSFDLVRADLAEHARVIVPTLRGHGLSDKPEQGYEMSDFADDVVQLLDVLGVERALFVGHSLSTAVALQIAADYPQRALGIVLIGAFGDFRGSQAIRELQAAIDGFDTDCGFAFAREFQESTLANPIEPDRLDFFVRESLRMPAHAWRGVARAFDRFDPRAAATRCQAPAAIIWGERDAYCPRADQLMLREALRSARLHILKRVGHAVHWEQPAATATLVRAFLAQVLEPRPAAAMG